MKNIWISAAVIHPVDSFPERVPTDCHGIVGQFWRGVTVYAQDGHYYRMKPVQPLPVFGAVKRFLARTIYNPEIMLPVACLKQKAYDFAELKAHIWRCVEQTDDLYTGVFPFQVLKQRINESTGFEQLHGLCFEMIFGDASSGRDRG